MKRKYFWSAAVLAGILACICTGSIFAYAQESVGDARLCVTGCASVEAEADLAIFGGCVEGMGNDMRSAEKACTERLQAVQKAFSSYGRVREEHSSAYPAGNGYTASRYLTFVTEQTDKAEEMRSALAEAGATCLEGTRYLCRDDEKYRLEALEKAIENAREKAKALGAEGDLVCVEEQSFCPCARNEESAGKVTFTATVRAVFAKRPQAKARERGQNNGTEPKRPAPDPAA